MGEKWKVKEFVDTFEHSKGCHIKACEFLNEQGFRADEFYISEDWMDEPKIEHNVRTGGIYGVYVYYQPDKKREKRQDSKKWFIHNSGGGTKGREMKTKARLRACAFIEQNELVPGTFHISEGWFTYDPVEYGIYHAHVYYQAEKELPYEDPPELRPKKEEK